MIRIAALRQVGRELLLLVALAAASGCGRGEAAPAGPPQADGRSLPVTAPSAGSPPDPAGAGSEQPPVRLRAEDLARQLYAALAAGDPGALASRLDRDGCEVLVDEGDPARKPFYALFAPGARNDWSPAVDWARARPPETILEVTSAVSPHDPRYVLVTVRLARGYAYFGMVDRGGGDDGGVAVTKLFLQTTPSVWD